MAISLTKGDVLLRSMEPEDLSFLYRVENDVDIWKVSNTLVPYSRYVLKQYIESSHHDIYTNKQLRLIICLGNTELSIGAIDLFDFDPYHLRAGVGIVLEKKYQTKGVAKIALSILIEFCFDHLQLHQLYCNITEENIASIKLFSNAGFELVGVKKDWIKSNKSWLNEGLYQLINV